MPPLTRTELRELLAIDRRRVFWCALGPFAGLVMLVPSLMIACDAMNRSGAPLSSGGRTLPFILIFPLILASIFALDRLFAWLDRSALAKCPGCRVPFFRRMEGYYAIVTGRCPECALTLFTNHESAESRLAELRAPGRHTRSDIKAAERQAHRAAVRAALKWAARGVLLLLVGLISTTVVQDQAAEWWGDVWAPFVPVVLVAPGIAVTIWALAIYGRRLPGCSSPSRSCPHCNAVLSDVASVTGNCSRCGKPAVADPFPGMVWTRESTAAATSQRTVAEFHGKTSSGRNRLWIGCLIGGGLAFLWVLPFVSAFSGFDESSLSLVESAMVFICFVGMFSLQCTGVVFWHRFLTRGLHCPECNHELLDYSLLVISSRRCYCCGCRVLNEDEF